MTLNKMVSTDRRGNEIYLPNYVAALIIGWHLLVKGKRQPTSHWILIIRSASSEKQKLCTELFRLNGSPSGQVATLRYCARFSITAVASGKLALSTGNAKDSTFYALS